MIFNDLGKKISQAGQTAVQKTKDITDIARINGMIAEEEKQMDNNYYQIGKLYVALHKNDFEIDFEEMITAVFISQAKIEEYRKQIGDIKGVIWCEKCGAEISSNAAFCSACGAPALNKEEKDGAKLNKCSNCGAEIAEKKSFCTACGIKLK